MQKELNLLRCILQHLRAGELQELQRFLYEAQHQDKYLFLLGNLPFFDNCKFQQQTQSGDVFLHDANLDRYRHLDHVSKQLRDIASEGAAGGGGKDTPPGNVTVGNRCNMLFVEGCLDKVQAGFQRGGWADYEGNEGFQGDEYGGQEMGGRHVPDGKPGFRSQSRPHELGHSAQQPINTDF